MKTTPSNSNNTTPSPNSHPSPPNFITAYGPKLVLQTHFTGPGRTKQAFKDECDINKIMSRYQKTGVFDFVTKHHARYGDVTGMDFEESMQIVAQAQSMFEDLPSSLRTRFENDPAKFMDFVHDPQNASEMHEMGLLRPDYTPPAANAATTSSDTPPAKSGGEPPAPKPAPVSQAKKD